MELFSPRLIYFRLSPDELANYLSWYTNDLVMKHITGGGLTRKEAEGRFKNALSMNSKFPDAGFYSVKKRNGGFFVGIAKLVPTQARQAEVGYGSLPEFWGNQYATEMLVCMIDRAREIPGISELIAMVHPDNTPSIRVLIKQEFRFLNKGVQDHRPTEYYIKKT